MAYRFYVALQGKKPSIHVTWKECKKLQKQISGLSLKGFNDFASAIQWVASKGGVLKQEDFPNYLISSEPILSEPIIVFHDKPLVSKDEIKIYTDGSCLLNPGGPGGFASILLLPDGREIRLSGKESSTTSNRMEIMAALSALDYLEQNHLVTSEISKVIVLSDSRYLVNIFKESWILNWQENGWVTTNGRPVQNKDLLEILEWLVNKLRVMFTWIRGHNDNYYNDEVNFSALYEAKQIAEEYNISLVEKSVEVSKKKKKKGFRKVSTTVDKNEIKVENKNVNEKKKFIKSFTLSVELSDGIKTNIVLSDKQSKLITSLLGITIEEKTSEVKTYTDEALESLFYLSK